MVLFFGLENTNRTFVPTFKVLNMLDGTLFVVFLVVNMLFLLFWAILSLNCISRKYLVAVYTVNRPSTPYCLFLTSQNVLLDFRFVLWLWKNHAHLFSNFENSKYVNGALFVVYFVLNTLSLVFWRFLTCNWISCG